jgi:hypothetical protein
MLSPSRCCKTEDGQLSIQICETDLIQIVLSIVRSRAGPCCGSGLQYQETDPKTQPETCICEDEPYVNMRPFRKRHTLCRLYAQARQRHLVNNLRSIGRVYS